MLLTKELLVLIPKESKGLLKWGKAKWFQRVILSTALLNDLLLYKKINLESKDYIRRSKEPLPSVSIDVVLIDNSSTGVPVLDEIFNYIDKEDSNNFVRVIQRISLTKKNQLVEQLWNELELDGIVQNKKKKHYLVNKEYKDKLLQKIRKIVINKEEPDDHMKALLGFIRYEKTFLGWKRFFKRSELDRKWFKEITENQTIPKMLQRMIIAIKANKGSGSFIYRIKI